MVTQCRKESAAAAAEHQQKKQIGPMRVDISAHENYIPHEKEKYYISTIKIIITWPNNYYLLL